MKIKSTCLPIVCFAILGLSGVGTAQHPHGKVVKRPSISRSHRKHRRERMATVTLTRNGKEVGYLRVPESVAKMMEKGKDKRIVVK